MTKFFMKYYLTRIAAIAVLLLTSACGSSVKSGDSSHSGHSTEQTHHGESSTTQAKLTAPKNLARDQSISLAIDVQDSQGKAVTNFDTFQEKTMHLIVVRDDLQSFNHVHPEYKGNGRFEVNTTFPTAGEYKIFSDYKPSGQKEQVSLMTLNIPGSVPLPKELEKFNTTKILNDTKINLKLSEPTPKTGQEVTLTFDVKQAANNQPVQGLQPYLGEKGHLVILKSSYPLTTADYIHAHALKETGDGQIAFKTSFPQPGTYKLWVQFNRNGKVNTADFWVNVS
jgi:plastocyanin